MLLIIQAPTIGSRDGSSGFRRVHSFRHQGFEFRLRLFRVQGPRTRDQDLKFKTADASLVIRLN